MKKIVLLFMLLVLTMACAKKNYFEKFDFSYLSNEYGYFEARKKQMKIWHVHDKGIGPFEWGMTREQVKKVLTDAKIYHETIKQGKNRVIVIAVDDLFLIDIVSSYPQIQLIFDEYGLYCVMGWFDTQFLADFNPLINRYLKNCKNDNDKWVCGDTEVEYLLENHAITIKQRKAK